MGYPRAKSLDCVVNMANRPALLAEFSCVVKKAIDRTARKIAAFDSKMAPKKVQFTSVRSSLQRLLNIKAGRAKVPTKVFNPFDSVCDIKLNLNKKGHE